MAYISWSGPLWPVRVAINRNRFVCPITLHDRISTLLFSTQAGSDTALGDGYWSLSAFPVHPVSGVGMEGYSKTLMAIDPMHVYEVHLRKDKRGFDLISDVLPFGRLWYGEQNVTGSHPGE